MSQKKNEGILFPTKIRVVGSYTDRLLKLQGSNGIRTHGLRGSAAVLHELSPEDPYIESLPVCWVHLHSGDFIGIENGNLSMLGMRLSWRRSAHQFT